MGDHSAAELDGLGFKASLGYLLQRTQGQSCTRDALVPCPHALGT